MSKDKPMMEGAKGPGLLVSVDRGVLAIAIVLDQHPRIHAALQATNAYDTLEAGTAWNELLQTIAHDLSVK